MFLATTRAPSSKLRGVGRPLGPQSLKQKSFSPSLINTTTPIIHKLAAPSIFASGFATKAVAATKGKAAPKKTKTVDVANEKLAKEKAKLAKEREKERELRQKDNERELKAKNREKAAAKKEKEKKLLREAREKARERSKQAKLKEKELALKEKIKQKKLKEKEEKAKKPKRAGTAFSYFLGENWAKIKTKFPPGTPVTQIFKGAHVQWAAMSAAAQEPYVKKQNLGRAKFLEARASYLQQHPKPPPKSAFARFVKTNFQTTHKPGASAPETLKILSQRWKSLSDREKKKYAA